jgi:hypothetical protein
MAFFDAQKVDVLLQSEKQLAIDAARFFESRNRLAQDLGQQSIDIKLVWSQFNPDQKEINQLKKELNSLIKKLMGLLRVYQLPLGDRSQRCAERRQKGAIECLRYVVRMTEIPGCFGECAMALDFISKCVGGIRLIGFCDETADEMDRQAQDLWNKHVPGRGDILTRVMRCFNIGDLNTLIPHMYSADPYCGCPWCRG